ncbi:Crp/Fnr family transcriptional regulator [Paenibacillus luteus]|uniref:Crp/Fnr family transcriptional regulator n=1 Tax=Paenibacillus luteus TaxID=2545753 RepID=UPI001142A7E7|nr:Crp/Fnr family transcriptional regulator [Paenibacillus luteus]
MEIILDKDKIKHYITEFDLNEKLTESDSLPIQLHTYSAGELVLVEGNELQGLYFQVGGLTKVSTSVGTGKSLLLRFCYPLSVFGDIELIQNVVIQSQVEAIQPSSFLFINKHIVENRLMHKHIFLNELLKHLSYKLQTCTTASRINLLASVEERLASYLLTIRLENQFGKEIQTSQISEISSLLGTTPRHLNRVIKSLCDIKILGKAHKSIFVVDWKRLDDLSNGLRYE